MLKRLKGAAVGCAALAITSTALFAAGSFSTLPVVEGSSYCASTVTGTSGGSGITGQGQGTTGSICAQTVPAGPTALTGNEVVPADLYNPSTVTATQGGTSPQTALIPMASLNALPLNVTTVLSQTVTSLNATNLTGGYVLHSAATMTSVTINLPPAPIDGQQFVIGADQTVTTLVVTPTAGTGQTVAKAPTVLTTSTTAPYGYRLEYNAALAQWTRLQ